MKKIKIAHIIYSLGTGGLENGLINIINGLNGNKFSHIICCCSQSGELQNRLNRAVPVYELKSRKHDVTLPFRLAAIFRREKPNIVHTRNWGTFMDTILAAKIARIPGTIYSFHGFLTTQCFPLRRRLTVRFLSKWTDQIFTVSKDTTKRWISVNNIPSNKVGTIYNGVDTKKFHPSSDKAKQKEKFGFCPNDILIGMVGSLTPIKDHKSFIKSISIVAKKIKNFKCIIIGDGPLSSSLKRLTSELNINEKVVFKGKQNDVSQWMQAMDIFVSCSLLEGMSNVILEAMASGLPIVATRVGGNPELIGKDGFLIPANDPQTLAEVILMLINSEKLRSKMGANGRKKAENEFNLEQMINSYEGLYLKVRSLCL